MISGWKRPLWRDLTKLCGAFWRRIDKYGEWEQNTDDTALATGGEQESAPLSVVENAIDFRVEEPSLP